MSEIVTNKGPPTLETIKAYWEAAAKPGERTVAKKMVADGWTVSPRTVGRAHKYDFKPKPPEVKPPSAETEAAMREEAIERAVTEMVGDVKDRLSKVLALSPDEIIERTRKLHLAAGYLLAEDLAMHTRMMMLTPEKGAKLYQALGSAVAPPPIKAPPQKEPEQIRDGSGARVIEGRALEPPPVSAVAQSIDDFLRKEGMKAA